MKIWLIGTGRMAIEYAKVLQALDKEFFVIGRGAKNCDMFASKTGIKAIPGGIESFIRSSPEVPDFVINAVGIDKLAQVTLELIDYGCKLILLEKPGIAYVKEIEELDIAASLYAANVYIAYNRRFYAAVNAARSLILRDSGVRSFNFEFTEWSHIIEKIEDKTKAELENWFLGNSTHVVDLAFFLGGEPEEISAYVGGKSDLKWHPTSSNFSGAGRSANGALFAYHADWCAPGRFSLEVQTKSHRYIFRPLEKLQIQMIGSVAIQMPEDIDYSLDELYKPGLYLQTSAFLNMDFRDLCTLAEQKKKIEIYRLMSGY
jgi:predicted dehydrogenase